MQEKLPRSWPLLKMTNLTIGLMMPSVIGRAGCGVGLWPLKTPTVTFLQSRELSTASMEVCWHGQSQLAPDGSSLLLFNGFN